MERRKTSATFYEDQPWCPPLTVYEEAAEPIDTGLFDASGTKIFRRTERQAIGFRLVRGTK